jgi:hypothetical protein
MLAENPLLDSDIDAEMRERDGVADPHFGERLFRCVNNSSGKNCRYAEGQDDSQQPLAGHSDWAIRCNSTRLLSLTQLPSVAPAQECSYFHLRRSIL